MILEWDRYSSDYNIFEHQITDISKITMTEYLDSSYAPRWDDDFKKFIVTESYIFKPNNDAAVPTFKGLLLYIAISK